MKKVFLFLFFIISSVKISSLRSELILISNSHLIKDSEFEKKLLNESKIYKTAELISTKIITPWGTGSGVLFNKKGNIYEVITAWHVIKDLQKGEEITVKTYMDNEYFINKNNIRRIGKLDLGVIKFKSNKTYNLANIGNSNDLKYNDKLINAGFPLYEKTINIGSGEVVANAQIGINNGYQLLYSNKTKPGMSGGAILNREGKLVGIHGRGEIDKKKFNQTDKIFKTGVNQGIPINLYYLARKKSPINKLIENPKIADDYLVLAKSQENIIGREQTMIRLINQYIKLRPENSRAYYLRGITYARLEDFNQCIKDYSKVIKDFPNEYIAFYNRGNCKGSLGNYEEAIKDSEEAIKINPNYYQAFYQKGYFFNKSGRCEEAIKVYEEAIKINPNYYQAFYAKGFCLNELGKKELAILSMDNVIRINPQYYEAYQSRGKYLLELGMYRKSIKDFDKAIEGFKGDSNSAYSYYGKGTISFKLGDYKSSIKELNKAIEINPVYASAFDLRGSAKRFSGNTKEAFKDYNKAIEIDNSNHLYFYNRGLLKAHRYNYEDALIDFNKSLELNPNDDAILFIRAITYKELKNDYMFCKDLKKSSSIGNDQANLILKKNNKLCYK